MKGKQKTKKANKTPPILNALIVNLLKKIFIPFYIAYIYCQIVYIDKS